jgi:hypothetical protein
MRIGFHFSALWSWIEFLAFTVLPIAFREILHWLHDWQILLTGVLALAAAYIWGKSVIRAARITARAAKQQVQSQTAPTQTPKRPPATPKVVPIPLASSGAPALEPHGRKPVPLPKSELADKLYALREQIRTTLGQMPCTDDLLSAERLEDCRRISEFPLGDPPANATKLVAHRFDVLRSELAALGAVRETDTCRNAWEALVRISMDARDMMGAEPAPIIETAPTAATK